MLMTVNKYSPGLPWDIDLLPDPRVGSPGPNKTPDGYRLVVSVPSIVKISLCLR